MKVAEHLVGKNSNGISRIKAARGLDGFSSQGLGNLAWSYAKQAQLIETAPRNISENSGRLAVYEASCRDIGESLIKRLFLSIAETAINRQSYLTKFKPQDLSNTCWAFATLGMFHREFFELVSSEVRKRYAVLLEGYFLFCGVFKYLLDILFLYILLDCWFCQIQQKKQMQISVLLIPHYLDHRK